MLFDEKMFPHCPDTMDWGHTCVEKYNLPEENILLEDNDGPQDVPDYWPLAGIDLQGGPRNHQLLNNNAPPDTHLHYPPLCLLCPMLSMGILKREEELHNLSQNRFHLGGLTERDTSMLF